MGRALEEVVQQSPGQSKDLSAMPRQHQAVVHELAGHYGVKSQALLQEPQRYVHLSYLPSAALPSKLLSQVASAPVCHVFQTFQHDVAV